MAEYAAPTNFVAGTSTTPYNVVAGDFNHDGKLDLATSNENAPSGTNNVSLFLNNGNGGFAGAVNFSILGGISTPQYLAVGDFDGDGRPDLITSNDNNQGKFVLLNTSPTFNTPPVVAANLAAVSANEGGTISNTGTFNDAQGRNTVTITASIGNVTQDNTLGTWSWSLNVADGPAGGNVTITARDSTHTRSARRAISSWPDRRDSPPRLRCGRS